LEIYKNEKPMIITPVERESLLNTPNPKCYICNSLIKDEKDLCIDHNHLTRKVCGVAHRLCNLAFRKPNFVSIFFHGGSHYDFKLIISEMLDKEFIKKIVSIIGVTNESSSFRIRFGW